MNCLRCFICFTLFAIAVVVGIKCAGIVWAYTAEANSPSKAKAASADKTKPTISNISVSPTSGATGVKIKIKAKVTDSGGIKKVYAKIKDANKKILANITLYDDGKHDDGNASDSTFARTWVSSNAKVGSYTVDIKATDKAGNTATLAGASTINFKSAGDKTKPTLSNISVSPASGAVGDKFKIKVKATDSGGVKKVYAKIKDADKKTLTNITLYDDGKHNDGNANDGIFSRTWNSSDANLGSYSIDINATDKAGNTATSSNAATIVLE